MSKQKSKLGKSLGEKGVACDRCTYPRLFDMSLHAEDVAPVSHQLAPTQEAERRVARFHVEEDILDAAEHLVLERERDRIRKKRERRRRVQKGREIFIERERERERFIERERERKRYKDIEAFGIVGASILDAPELRENIEKSRNKTPQIGDIDPYGMWASILDAHELRENIEKRRNKTPQISDKSVTGRGSGIRGSSPEEFAQRFTPSSPITFHSPHRRPSPIRATSPRPLAAPIRATSPTFHQPSPQSSPSPPDITGRHLWMSKDRKDRPNKRNKEYRRHVYSDPINIKGKPRPYLSIKKEMEKHHRIPESYMDRTNKISMAKNVYAMEQKITRKKKKSKSKKRTKRNSKNSNKSKKSRKRSKKNSKKIVYSIGNKIRRRKHHTKHRRNRL